MTTAVLAPPSTRTERREPLGTIGMAASQAQSRASAPGKARGPRRSTRNSANQQGLEEITNNDSKRKASYEDDEGFQFARYQSTPHPTWKIPQYNQRHGGGRPPKKRVGETTATTAKGKSIDLPTRRPAKGAMSSEPDHHQEHATRSARPRDYQEEQPEQKKRKPGRPAKSKTADANGFRSPEPTKVALPVADTPVIQRNKELRGKKSGKGRRRISSEMRGRRASSLIDSGASNALPHREVRTAEFYKHIADEGLSEPRRMRQLLIWCATRALGDKPSSFHQEDQSAHLAARVIQEDLQKEFSSNSNLSDWFSREELHPASVVVKKPNPRNVQNTDKIKELEEQILKLQKERHALNALLKQPPIPRIDTESNPPPKKSPRSKNRPQKNPREEIDTSLLDPSQKALYKSLNPPRINHRRRIIHLLKIPTPTLFHLPLRCFSPPLSNHDRTRPDTRRFCGRTPRHRTIPIYSRYLLITSPTNLRPTSRRTRCAKYAAASRDRRRGQRDPSFFFTRGPVTATAEARSGAYTWSS
ncbi:hypothetical protein N7509_005089 [Penicillium cosmopolitanum]|uniref:Kinetochore protein mis13 n=1 Tax=Penicillium cosmopolitanum TaxID=1131564 RepID=A0A9X0B9P5_9EURO|nr:uncharacterized protein N7509_005089 [Penicillium cosmopolitanum]KAJ5396976.1 hypothetical protein N7509_005089 [Penicillium cosmopolitanum]